jgi:hypothetical protein
MIASLRLTALILLAFFFCAGGACAQSVGLDEAVGPNGALAPLLALTPLQRSAIYNAVMQQHTASTSREIAATIGAPVPPSAALRDLPDQAALGGDMASLLKYAMVEDDVVVVDPIRMRVVDVIHRGARP